MVVNAEIPYPPPYPEITGDAEVPPYAEGPPDCNCRAANPLRPERPWYSVVGSSSNNEDISLECGTDTR